jgi:ion channel
MLFSLLISGCVFLVSLVCFAMTTTLIVNLAVRLIRVALGFWKSVAIMMIVSLVTATAHLIEIALWAAVYLICGEVASFRQAFYCSAQNYTALGYGDIHISERWQLLGPLEAVNGLLLFGLSTAIMFSVLSNLIAKRLHLEIDRLGKD